MKIIIDIDSHYYNWVLSTVSSNPEDYNNMTELMFRKAIEHGTVLPEEYGDLIDRDVVLQNCSIIPSRDRLKFNQYIKLLSPVIPADKENKE